MKPAIALLLAAPLLAQIRFLPDKKLWVLETDRSSYVLGVNEQNSLQNVYWGKRLARDADLTPAHTSPEHASFDSRETMTNEEYPGWGGLRYNEPCVKVTLADGTRDLVLAYVSHEIRGDTLAIHTQDIRYPLQVDVLYRVFPRSGILEKRSVIRNATGQPVVVESAQSGVWYVPAGEGYRLSYLSGRWAGETQLHREPVLPGKKVLESRRGNTSHQAKLGVIANCLVETTLAHLLEVTHGLFASGQDHNISVLQKLNRAAEEQVHRLLGTQRVEVGKVGE